MLNIKIFGTGCKKCEILAEDCRQLATEMNLAAQVEKVTDHEEIFRNGVLLTPGLMINGRLLTSGKAPTAATLKNWIRKAAEEKF